MLTDKQSLILCGFMAVGIFVAGVLDILDNFVILTVLTITFLAIILNLVVAKSFVKKEEELEE
ncbi:hypothetical protein E1J38_010760 [Seonamhaeicola sediminis]|uniref:Uncharacterized protein n=1 Tax=Seonamhaeicola sediminis TaxID=2528206 RepID=A0A562YCS6_9FLAO|nr:hypothetical protein [Seonamhaeicola sediminis]TWO31859.1 hypothetical protein E1J38_010760 [Seonamhaeicola sediminis]